MLLVGLVDGDSHGRLEKIPIRAGTLGDAETMEIAGGHRLSSPRAMTVSEQGYMVIGFEGQGDSQLAFFNPIDGAVVMRFDLGLSNLVALAYNPVSPGLFAAAGDGVYRIDDASQPGKLAIKAVKRGSVARPAGMAFGPDGALYLTSTSASNMATPNGTVVKFTGDL
jgi:hypothetical protein